MSLPAPGAARGSDPAPAPHDTIHAMPHHPDRVFRLQGTTNFRDLGGYAGHGGRPLRWRRLFRAAHPGGLTAADQAAVAALGLKRSFDFRGIDERAATPYHLPGVAQHALTIEPTVAQSMQAVVAVGEPITAARMAEFMRVLYRSLINDHAHRFAELFEQLLADDAPAMFHCTAGKDRTGVAAALILLALGVSREVVMQDYLLTNDLYTPPVLPQSTTPPEALAVMWSVQPSFLHAAFEVVDADHGGIEVYLQQRLGLSRTALDALSARYLQPG